MTNELIFNSAVASLLAKTDPANIRVVSPETLDALYVQERIGHPVSCLSSFPFNDSSVQIVIAPIAMDGFFDYLGSVDRTKVKVIAIVNNTPEETVTAKFVRVASLLRKTVSVNNEGALQYI